MGQSDIIWLHSAAWHRPSVKTMAASSFNSRIPMASTCATADHGESMAPRIDPPPSPVVTSIRIHEESGWADRLTWWSYSPRNSNQSRSIAPCIAIGSKSGSGTCPSLPFPAAALTGKARHIMSTVSERLGALSLVRPSVRSFARHIAAIDGVCAASKATNANCPLQDVPSLLEARSKSGRPPTARLTDVDLLQSTASMLVKAKQMMDDYERTRTTG